MALEDLSNGNLAPIGHQLVQCHMVFDIKMKDFTQKARLAAGGHMTKSPSFITYSRLVSMETVRIALMIATINDLQLKFGNILYFLCLGTCN